MHASWNWDEMLAFKTPRFVRIRDRRLGIMNLVFLGAIVGYIGGYLILYEKGYYEEGDAIGVRRLRLREPSSDILASKDMMPYCGERSKYYKAEVPNAVVAPKAPCQYLDEISVGLGSFQSDSSLLTTRVTQIREERDPSQVCANMTEPYCSYNKTDEGMFYVADPEFYTLFISHSVAVTKFDYSDTGWDLQGRMLDADGNKIDPCKPYRDRGKQCPPIIQIGEPREYDIFPVQSLIEATKMESLDSRGGDIGEIQNETSRFSGRVILIELEYDNFHSFDPGNVRYVNVSVNYTASITSMSHLPESRYTLMPQAIRNTEFKVNEFKETREDGAVRLQTERHGLWITLRPVGSIGTFRFSELLIVLVSSIGLLAVSDTIVNFTAFRILPMRWVYRQYREVDSVNYNDVRDLPPSQIRRFRNEDLVNPRPKVFTDASNGMSALKAGGSNPHSRSVNKNATKRTSGFEGEIAETSSRSQDRLNPLRENSDGVEMIDMEHGEGEKKES